MRIAFLAGANDIHTVRWVNSLAGQGVDVHLVTQHRPRPDLSAEVTVHTLPVCQTVGYFVNSVFLRVLLARLQPCLLHAHYASGYGTLGRLCSFRPFLLSVWGSDVYDFPKKSFLHRNLLIRNLSAADAVASTSHCMARRVTDLAPHLAAPVVTPFGVDCHRFRPVPRTASLQGFTVGTVKKLAPKYGIDTLIEAFALFLQLKGNDGIDCRLRIVGGGQGEAKLRSLADRLGVGEATDFVGPVSHDMVPCELNKLDVFCALSRLDSESFGVAAVEAAACERAVVVSDAEGLREVVAADETGLIVERDSPHAAAEAILRLYRDPGYRTRLGQRGRERVQENYEWNDCVAKMLAIYSKLYTKPQKSLP